MIAIHPTRPLAVPDLPDGRPLTRGDAGAPAGPPVFDRTFWVTAAVLAVALVVPKLMMHASGHTADLDTGNYSNYAWGILHGQGFHGSVLGRHHLGEHFSPIMVLVAPMYLVRATAYNLMLLQGLAVTAGVALTLAFAARRLMEAGFAPPRMEARAAGRVRFLVNGWLLLLMALYPPLLATWNTQFQPVELGFPLVIGVMYLMHVEGLGRRGHVLLALLVVLLLMTRESAPLSVLGLAIYAAGARRHWRLAIVLALVAAAWLWLAMGVAMPYFRDGERWGHTRWLGWDQMWDLKSFYLAAMVGGMGFLPLLGGRALWATAGAVPGILLNLSVAREPQIAFQAHYDAQTCAFLLIAAAHGATWLTCRLFPPGTGRVRDRRSWQLAAVLAAGAVASAAVFCGQAHTNTLPERWHDWWPRTEARRMISQSKTMARKYADAPVLAGHARVGPHVAHRPNYRSIRVKDLRKWPEWAAERMEPGTILIVPTEAYMPDDGVLHVVRNNGRAQLVERLPRVEVWRWPLDAPPANTPEALEYARSGVAAAAEARAASSPADGRAGG